MIALPLADGLQPQEIPLAQAVLIAQDRQQHGDMAGAEKIYDRILGIDPDHGDALFFLGLLNHQMGKTREAFKLMALATQKHPKVFKYHYNIGLFYDEVSAYDKAAEAFRQAIAIDPKPIAWGNLGKVLKQMGELDEAVECSRQCIKLQPHHQNALAYNNLGGALQQQGKLEEAVESFAAGLSIEPRDPMVRSNYLYMLNFLPGQDLPAHFEAHKEFGKVFDRPMPPRPEPSGDPRRRLRIGYVSPDFRQHSVAYFIEPILAAHDRDKFEVFCYSNHAQNDDVTKRMKSLAPNWRLILNRPDAEVAQLVRDDGIDILVDLAGHTAQNSLPLFGLKPAPVQVTWLGYPNTTGMRTVDYRITDRFADPPGEADARHTEKLWRLPEGFSCFQAPLPSPDVGPLPAAGNGHVTFGSFNNFAKTNPRVIELWARILKGVPGSRLVLKNMSMGAKHVREFIHSNFTRHGVAAAQIQMMDPEDAQFVHLDRYNSIDIALDPFPYNGTTTTFEALWMGVPVVTLEGRSHVSRVGVSQMSNLGLPELIGRNPDDYAAIAAGLAGDLPRLAALRRGLRQRMQASPLMDVPRFIHHLEEAYRAMWKIHLDAGVS